MLAREAARRLTEAEAAPFEPAVLAIRDAWAPFREVEAFAWALGRVETSGTRYRVPNDSAVVAKPIESHWVVLPPTAWEAVEAAAEVWEALDDVGGPASLLELLTALTGVARPLLRRTPTHSTT